jgi:hypothetical protein
VIARENKPFIRCIFKKIAEEVENQYIYINAKKVERRYINVYMLNFIDKIFSGERKRKADLFL